MKAFVITIMEMKESIDIAARCVESGAAVGVEVERWKATTPADNPYADKRFNLNGFSNNRYSRMEPCVSAFLSHASLWQKSIDLDEAVLVLEHDAVFTLPVPDNDYGLVCNVGKPSYGSFRVPKTGLHGLASKRYLPGAHAYIVQPAGAQHLLDVAKDSAMPTDVFIHLDRFPWLSEFYPWPVECQDSFTTIQRESGCRAKHNKVSIL